MLADRRLVILTGFLFFFVQILSAQTQELIKSDSLVKLKGSDSLRVQMGDSLRVEMQNDSLEILIQSGLLSDSIQRVSYSLDSIAVDSILLDSTYILDTIPFHRDSILFNNDSLALSYLENLLQESPELFSDSTRNLIHLFSLYNKLPTKKSLLNEIGGLLDKDSIYFHGDSLNRFKYDSSYVALNRLYEKNKMDSSSFVIGNLNGDYLRVNTYSLESKIHRYWLKNILNDSVGVWLNTKGTDTLTIFVDPDVQQVRVRTAGTRVEKLHREEVDKSLHKVTIVKYQKPEWTFGGNTSITFSQGYVSYWAKGGESNIATLSDLTAFAKYSKNKTKWDNQVRLKYGVMKPGEKNLRKNEDLLHINTKLGFQAFNNWYYSFLTDFKTQFTKGYDYPNDSIEVSDFMNPAYIEMAMGLDYKYKNKLSVLVSPLTGKFTYVRDTARIDQTKYGLEPDEKLKKEMGATIKGSITHNFTDDIQLFSKIDLFSNYVDKPQNIDVDWELKLNMKINMYITTVISTHMIYDDDVLFPVMAEVDGKEVKVGDTKKIQFKEYLSLGFVFKF